MGSGIRDSYRAGGAGIRSVAGARRRRSSGRGAPAVSGESDRRADGAGVESVGELRAGPGGERDGADERAEAGGEAGARGGV